MFDIGALELLVVAVVAIIVIGPKDMPAALRVAGRWVGKIRRASAQFRSGFDALVREAEMEDMEKKWKEQNARIMAETPESEPGESVMGPLPAETPSAPKSASGEPVDLTGDIEPAKTVSDGSETSADEPKLPLDKPTGS